MRIVDLLLVAFQRENFDHSSTGAHGKHALVSIYGQI